jgi:hypothetical protein
MTITTIKLEDETKQRLEKLREHKRESYDDLLKKILFILNTAKAEPEKARGILFHIDEIRKRNQIQEEKLKKERK